MEIILEAAFGKKFKLQITKGGIPTTFLAMATANAKPGELPYRITWFSLERNALGYPDNRHVDLTFEEMQSILNTKIFPPEIVKRIQMRYAKDTELKNMVGDEYTIESSPS
jgi:hypothetical protein